jgi:hypothetical protein
VNDPLAQRETVESTVSPSPTPRKVEPPPASGYETAGAILAIVFALAAAIIGFRIIRGGRGL